MYITETFLVLYCQSQNNYLCNSNLYYLHCFALQVGKNNIPEEFAETGLLILRNCPVLKLETLDMTVNICVQIT